MCRQVTVECSTRGGLLTKVLLGINVVFLWAMKSMSGLCGALEARLHALCHAVEMVEEQNERWASLTEILRVELHLVSRNGGPGPSTGRSGGGDGDGERDPIDVLIPVDDHHRHDGVAEMMDACRWFVDRLVQMDESEEHDLGVASRSSPDPRRTPRRGAIHRPHGRALVGPLQESSHDEYYEYQ